MKWWFTGDYCLCNHNYSNSMCVDASGTRWLFVNSFSLNSMTDFEIRSTLRVSQEIITHTYNKPWKWYWCSSLMLINLCYAYVSKCKLLLSFRQKRWFGILSRGKWRNTSIYTLHHVNTWSHLHALTSTYCTSIFFWLTSQTVLITHSITAKIERWKMNLETKKCLSNEMIDTRKYFLLIIIL